MGLFHLEVLSLAELLEIKNLNIRFTGGGRETEVISDLTLSLGRKETLGIVGDSGSGKSVTFAGSYGITASRNF